MKLGQLLMIGIEDTRVTPETAAFVKQTGCGGVILFRKNLEGPRQIAELIRDLGDAAEAPLVIGIDGEGGRVVRLPPPFVKLPPMAVLGRLDDGENFVAGIGEIIGKELAACGFNINFSPVLDVGTNKSSPAIGDRAFSHDPEVVSRLGRSFIGALQSQGVAACGKHFPGHGDADVDSHVGLPVLPHSLKRLGLCELEPFEAAIAAGVAAIMTAHVMVPNLDARSPATVSWPITTGLLRRRLGFEGVVFTDDLDMRGISDIHPPAEAAWRAIGAGADIALICHGRVWVFEALEKLKRAVGEGLLNEDKVAAALARIAGFKTKYCCAGARRPPMEVIGCKEHKNVLEELRGKVSF